MSQRDSGYARIEHDQYETPEWVTAALLPHLPKLKTVLEPACGSGKMVSVLAENGFDVTATDILQGQDFLHYTKTLCEAVITNPPYALAQEFIEHALGLMLPWTGIVAMLLRTDYDHAKTRQHLFGRHQAFAKKVVLTKRIQWFEESRSAPSFNHAWFVWDWTHQGPPILAYGPG